MTKLVTFEIKYWGDCVVLQSRYMNVFNRDFSRTQVPNKHDNGLTYYIYYRKQFDVDDNF